MNRLQLANFLQAGFSALILLAAVWLLSTGLEGFERATLPKASAPPSRVALHRLPTPTSFIATVTPQPVIHIVQPGEVLGLIAEQYETSVEAILEANGLSDANVLAVGQELIIAGAKRTPLVTVVHTPLPTSTPTSPFRYMAPVLIAPSDGEAFHGREAHIQLSWTSVAILKEAEWYEIKLWAREQGQSQALRFWTKASSWSVPAFLYPAGSGGFFCWNVCTVQRSGSESFSLSAASDTRCFQWY